MPSLLFCCGGALCIGWQAIAAPASGSAGQPLTGLLLAIGALVSWTAYAVGNSRCLARLPQVTVYDWNLAIGLMTGLQALLLIPVSVATEPLDYSLSQWSQFATVSIGVAFLASIAGNGLWNRMSRLLPLTMVGQMILFETVFALIYGFVWEQRLPSLLEVMAFVMVTASVFTCIAAHRRPANA
nr:DMT family transporter [Hyphomonas sediminis]